MVVQRSKRNIPSVNYAKLNSGKVMGDANVSSDDDEFISNQQAAKQHEQEKATMTCYITCQFCKILFQDEETFKIHQVSNCCAIDNEPDVLDKTVVQEGQFDASSTQIIDADEEDKLMNGKAISHECNELNMLRTDFEEFKEFICRKMDSISGTSEKTTICSTECFHRETQLKALQTENTILKDQLILQKDLFKFMSEEYNRLISVRNKITTTIPATTPVTTNIPDTSLKQNNDFIFPKKTVKAKNTSKELLDRNISTKNYFGPLAYINNEPPSVKRRLEDSGDRNNLSKPNIKKVPGNRIYSQAHQRKVAIISDSMSGQLRTNTLNSYLKGDQEKAVMSKNPGATARKIKHNSKFDIEEEDPDVLVIIAGVNDILYGCRNGKSVNEHTVAKDIMDIARQGKEMGVSRIYVSGIVVMANSRLDRIRHRVNTLLQALCIDEGFIYLSHDNIVKSDLCSDQLHLNTNGLKVLMDNILGSCCTMYNPYLTDYYNSIR